MGDDTGAQRQQDERAALERRVRDGAWLKLGAVAKLLEVGRTTAHNMVNAGLIRYRWTPSRTQRECNPEDVVRLLDERRQMHGGAAQPSE